MPSPHQVIGAKFAIDGLSLIFAIARTLATRKRQGSRYTLAANIFLFLTFATDLTATGIFIWIMIEEQKIIERYNGDPAKVIPEVGNPDYTKIFYVAHFFYYLSVYMLKIAYLAHYAQLFVRTVTKKKMALYGAGVITIIAFLSGVFIQLLGCRPLSDNWNPTTTNPNCPTLFNHKAFSTIAWINIVSDLFIMGVPMLIVSDLRLSKREKYGLIGIFVVGGSSIIVSVIRYVLLGQKILNKEFNWDTLHFFALISHAEVLFGIIAFSLPAFRPVFRRVVGEITSRFTTQGTATGNSVTEMSSRSRTGADEKKQEFSKVRDTEWGPGDSVEALRK